jgi:hypothetical protein
MTEGFRCRQTISVSASKNGMFYPRFCVAILLSAVEIASTHCGKTTRTGSRNDRRLSILPNNICFHGLADQMQAGIVGGMSDILAAQSQAECVITL